MNYPAEELRGIKRNYLLFNPDALHRGILLIKITKELVSEILPSITFYRFKI